jgi:predicted oxidoreductase
MEKKLIHPKGPKCSRIIAGAWRWHTVPSQVVDELINTALDQGITTFDHADIYGDHSNEEIFGRSLRSNSSLRNKMQLVTKCGIKFPSAKRPKTWVKHYDTSKEYIIWSAENSLKTLGTDRLDLLLIHRPDPLLDPDVVAEAFTQLREQGKVLHFGVSNFTSSQFELLQSRMDFPLVTNQIELSVTAHAPMFDGTLDTLMIHHASPMAWSPLGGGKLMDQSFGNVFAKSGNYNATDNQMALAWLLKHPSRVFPVIGTTRPERIIESARAMNVNIDLQDWFEMLKVVQGKEMP